MRIAFALALCVFAAAPSAAQAPLTPPPAGEQMVDQVAAVVGDTVLLLSDLYADLQRLQNEGVTVPTEPRALERFMRDLLSQRVDDLILLEAARDAGIQAQDDQVSQSVEQQVKRAQSSFGSEAEFRAALAASGLTLEQYRAMLTAQARDGFLIESFRQQRLQTAPRPPVSDEEMREFFAAQKAGLGARPANLSFDQVVVPAQPSDSAKAAARERAQQVYKELAEGIEFDVLARRYSEDPGSKEHGGDLGWFRRGRMVAAFENAVYAMRPGDVSTLVESPFGYHIIKLEKVRGAERQAKHILIKPVVTEADIEAARLAADSIAAAARAGQPLPVRAVPATAELPERVVEHIMVDRLPPTYAAALDGANTGDVVGPFRSESPVGTSWVVARVTQRQESGEYSLDDLREQVRERLQQQKMLEQLVDDLRQSVYVRMLL